MNLVPVQLHNKSVARIGRELYNAAVGKFGERGAPISGHATEHHKQYLHDDHFQESGRIWSMHRVVVLTGTDYP